MATCSVCGAPAQPLMICVVVVAGERRALRFCYAEGCQKELDRETERAYGR